MASHLMAVYMISQKKTSVWLILIIIKMMMMIFHIIRFNTEKNSNSVQPTPLSKISIKFAAYLYIVTSIGLFFSLGILLPAGTWSASSDGHLARWRLVKCFFFFFFFSLNGIELKMPEHIRMDHYTECTTDTNIHEKTSNLLT